MMAARQQPMIAMPFGLRNRITICGCALACRVEADLGRALTEEEARIVRRMPGGTTAAEAAQLLHLHLRAVPPVECGPEMVAAPARGPMRVVASRRMVGAMSVRDGFSRMEEADVFDRMERAARDAWSKALSLLPEAEQARLRYVPPFSSGQVAMARRYRALVESHSAGGVKCSTLDGSGGGDGGGFMDAYLAEGDELRRLWRAIGPGVAMALRRLRPSARGSRISIKDRALVDAVCLAGRSISEVLRAHGWADKGEYRAAARVALAAALDRMQGHRDARAQNPA